MSEVEVCWLHLGLDEVKQTDEMKWVQGLHSELDEVT